ncbi:uncharacterized protein LOC107845671 isoform X2 [Capsicum annuum]|uniref:uncharacterized protein LOC107845671 isoform X2 n=1 Tax=Capsicum annuum TaxID=4072 RepID=UPI0007BEEFE0|nr:uncharacterized protein LOC107845671 isoform X2 [Capsicum annuum]
MRRMDKDTLVLEKENMQANISLPLSVDQVMNTLKMLKKDKFEGVELSGHQKHILRWMNELWNKWRGYLYGTFVKNKSLQQALKNKTNGIDKKEWEWLVKEHFSSEAFQEKSKRNVANRAMLTMLYHMKLADKNSQSLDWKRGMLASEQLHLIY